MRSIVSIYFDSVYFICPVEKDETWLSWIIILIWIFFLLYENRSRRNLRVQRTWLEIIATRTVICCLIFDVVNELRVGDKYTVSVLCVHVTCCREKKIKQQQYQRNRFSVIVHTLTSVCSCVWLTLHGKWCWIIMKFIIFSFT